MWISYLDGQSSLHWGQNIKVQSWIVPGGKSSPLRRPSGANKAGLFSLFKSPTPAEVTDLQLRYGPDS